MVLPKLKILKFYGCYVLQRILITQFQGLENFSFVLSLRLQGLDIHFNGRDWGRSGIDVGLRRGVHGFGSIGGVDVLRTRGGLVVLTGTVSQLSASEAQFLPDAASSFRWSQLG